MHHIEIASYLGFDEIARLMMWHCADSGQVGAANTRG
jgi:hypothetical protein